MEDEASSSPSLQHKVEELEAKQRELLDLLQDKENEFGIKRAQFMELFVQKEAELKDHVTKLQKACDDNEKLSHELKEVSSERDNLKTIILITKTTSDEEFQAMKLRHQEEITSLKAIMQDAVLETRQQVSANYESEQQRLLKTSHDLEAKLAKYKACLKELRSRPMPEEDANDGLFDVIPVPWKQPGAFSPNNTVSADNDEDDNLEESMKKAQENAETLRAIVMPLEEEIASLRSKLKNASEKINVLESKERKHFKHSQSDTASIQSVDSTASSNIEEMEDKVKELSQYLEAERSSRTDLEMYVAVLNTQKGVLQEDADKIRKELHNVCRILEQEKEEHNALKDTWEMANDRFLATQREQGMEIEKIRKLLSEEQKRELKEQGNDAMEKVELLTPPSPGARHKFPHRKLAKEPVGNKFLKTKKITSSDAKRTLASLVRGHKSTRPVSPSTPQSSLSILDADIPSLDMSTSPLLPVNTPPTILATNGEQPGFIISHNDTGERTFSDDESSASVGEKAMKKYKSADDLEQELISDSAMSVRSRSHDFAQSNLEKSAQLENFVAKHGRERIDWTGFEEAAKSSYTDDIDEACAMCGNYEKQLQNFQRKNEGLIEQSTYLSQKLKEEQETVVVVNRAYENLEQNVKMASEDAQAQINAASETQNNLEMILEEIKNAVAKTKSEDAQMLKEIMESRDSLMARCEQLAENYNNQQSKNPNTSDELVGDKELQQYQAVSKTRIEKLQSEIHFMKDRIMAEQVAKENLEEFYQSDINKLESDIKSLRRELEMERQQNQQLGQQPQLVFEGSASNEVIAVLEKQLQQSLKEKTELKKQLQETKSQIHSLNGQLNSSESVQRDFVKLSQSLQMELEEIKESQKEVKWEHEDDVTSCRKCGANLNSAQEKHHCKQCGKIFCDGCASTRTVSTRPESSQKPLRVCVDCFNDVTGSDVGGGKLGQYQIVE